MMANSPPSPRGSTVTSFIYDALGRRVSRTAGGTTTNFLLDGGAVLLEKQGTTTTATYTYGNGLIRKDGETPLFDGLGSERTVTNSSQTVTGTATYEGFGQTVATTGSSTDPYMFAATSGYRNDGDAGLMQVGARYYDSQVGRFISRDTYLDQKPYLYCNHDPINQVDPTGHFGSWKEIVGVILTGLGVVGAVASAPVWIPIVLIIGGGALIYSGAMDEIHEHERAIQRIGDGMNGPTDGLGSGHGGMTAGPGDFDHMTNGWEHETGG